MVRKETKINYGLLLVGAAMPPIVAGVFGEKWGLGAFVLVACAGLFLLVLGHFDKEEGANETLFKRRAKFTLIGAVIAIALVGFKWAKNKSGEQPRERAYLHVEDVKVSYEVTQESTHKHPVITAIFVSGRNESTTPTTLNPRVFVSISVGPVLRSAADEHDKLFVHGLWGGQQFIKFNDVLGPFQEFNFRKDEYAHSLPDGDVLYVVTKAEYADKWGALESYSCHEFYWQNTGTDPGLREGFCWSKFMPPE